MAAVFTASLAVGQDAGESGNEAPWYVLPALGWIDYEGNEEYHDSFVTSVALGYDFNERWTFESILNYAPLLHGKPQPWPTQRYRDTYFLGLAVDGLFHFTRWDRVDPYLAAGVGLTYYGEALETGFRQDFVFRGGGGVIYHFNDEWAIRADGRGMLVDFARSPDANAIYSAGVMWTWGARVPERLVAIDGPLDSDGDGLTDEEEAAIGTDPFDPDTDKDRLTDGQEVKQYNTNPLNPDTDMDHLRDGDEVLDHGSNPLVRDTDAGGVADGHEVLEDHTNPLDPSDDLYLVELYIQFDYDKAIIKPQFFPDLDVVAKVLTRNPASTAKIEGHADKTRKSVHAYNMRLSKRRAQAVLNYFADTHAIARSRMEAEGYGFTRPKAENDPIHGNPLNRRVDVYIRGVDRETLLENAASRPPPVEVPIAPDTK